MITRSVSLEHVSSVTLRYSKVTSLSKTHKQPANQNVFYWSWKVFSIIALKSRVSTHMNNLISVASDHILLYKASVNCAFFCEAWLYSVLEKKETPKSLCSKAQCKTRRVSAFLYSIFIILYGKWIHSWQIFTMMTAKCKFLD